jgi:hypothetical protein
MFPCWSKVLIGGFVVFLATLLYYKLVADEKVFYHDKFLGMCSVDPDIGRLVDIQDYPGKILPGIYWIKFGNIKLTRTMHATEMCSLVCFVY